ncbi:hypothetical protein HELRODRAFT_175134 [Helobdella robusta]|uniref:BRICHOS domain-containing protein n=1 Tax=Helobdella robusta TaxID=6412 RepID=T1F8W6_HELRO|nr:hypothetical protein HELRODRAFT_175134 [Helobdella robusta]ESO01104.1 hypothetical protein HELRODRAFT_175134 [Helobdella robusta]
MKPKLEPSKEVPKLSERKHFKVGVIVSFVLLVILIICAVAGILAYVGVQSKMIEVVSSDPIENVVKYHVQDANQEAWIVNDFNTDIKVTKIASKIGTNCFISPLNRSKAMEPAKITVPESSVMDKPSELVSTVFKISGEPIEDNSFLNKMAREMCKAVITIFRTMKYHEKQARRLSKACKNDDDDNSDDINYNSHNHNNYNNQNYNFLCDITEKRINNYIHSLNKQQQHCTTKQ